MKTVIKFKEDRIELVLVEESDCWFTDLEFDQELQDRLLRLFPWIREYLESMKYKFMYDPKYHYFYPKPSEPE